MKRLALLFAACALTAAAQHKTFDVVSIKPSPPPGGSGGMVRMMMGSRFGPGTPDPTRWACDNCTLMSLLTQAYNLKRFQITGPAWLDNDRFDITARVTEGSTKDDLRLMQQSMLVERFGMKSRLEQKEMPVYDLVLAKGGPKFKESTTTPADPGTPMTFGGRGGAVKIDMGSDGFPNLPPGRTMTMSFNGNSKHQAVAEDIKQFTDLLAGNLDKPVTDSTGLKGKYDFTLTFAGGNGRGGPGSMMVTMREAPGDHATGGNPLEGLDPDAMSQPPLQKAIQDQLGLRLEPQKGLSDLLTIDTINKTPTEN